MGSCVGGMGRRPIETSKHDEAHHREAPRPANRRHILPVTAKREFRPDPFESDFSPADVIVMGRPLDSISNHGIRPPSSRSMADCQDKNSVFMIRPFTYDRSHPDREPESSIDGYRDTWNTDHVCMPCSNRYVNGRNQPMWPRITECLSRLKQDCDNKKATFEKLQKAIEECNEQRFDMRNLGTLINHSFSSSERETFLSTTLSYMCSLVLNITKLCSQPPPLLSVYSERSVTMSQQQAASLLACAFFCLFPFRTNVTQESEYRNYPDPNFHRLYQQGSVRKIEKLRCILHYFRRISEKMPTGVITYRRRVLDEKDYPQWHESSTPLSSLHLTTGRKIEDINGVLQVDFANKYIGGGVLGEGCVQEEIRFSICPEMLVSLILCERMEENECVFLIGCERFSNYKGYADSFQFAGDYRDETIKDSWGRKWCHVVAMDAIFFRDASTQYEMKNINRELLKAYTSFLPVDGTGPLHRFGIATGNWGCGAFNGETQLKAVIQLLAASQAGRPLVYAAFGDRRLVQSFGDVYNYLSDEKATVADLYAYLQKYSHEPKSISLFDMIRTTPLESMRKKFDRF